MDPVTVSILIDQPRELVFDYLADISNHAEFTDHFLVDWHLTRVDPVGAGAGARYRIKAPPPGNRFAYGDATFSEVSRPNRIVEVGRTGKFNRVRTLGVYELAAASGGGTRVSYTLETQPRTLSDRITESLGGRSWVRRKNQRAMRRLRAILERGEQRGKRATVAGG